MRTLLLFHVYVDHRSYPADSVTAILEGELTPERLEAVTADRRADAARRYVGFAAVVLAQIQPLATPAPPHA